MRDLYTVAIECMKELDAIDVKYGNIIDFKVNTRAKKRWGQCKKVYNEYGLEKGFEININVVLLDERNSIESLKDTLFHEIIHTCKGCMNHGENWKRIADKVNRAYGYNIKRCSSSAEKGIDKSTIDTTKRIERKYIIQCTKCNALFKRSRMSRVVTHPEEYRCGHCKGELVRIK